MRRYTLATLSLMAFFLLAQTAMAQTHQHGDPQHGDPQQERGPGYAGLTPEQSEALAALREEHRRAVMLPNLEMKAKQAELDVLLAAPQADRAKITAVTNDITALHGKILAAQNDYRRKVFEETGYLIRDGMGMGCGMGMRCGMKHGAQGHGMGGQMCICPNCPMMPSP